MMISVSRQVATHLSTIGQMTIDKFQCFTLEDPMRHIKIKGDTCIPEGQYAVTLRTDGGMHARYLEKFGDWHKGMLWVRDIPNFEYVYIHIGNSPADTEGCILVGTGASKDFISQSTDAYKRLYPIVSGAILSGEDVLIDVRNPE